jgi:hypothetical protein
MHFPLVPIDYAIILVLKKNKKTNKYSPIVVETKQEFLSENVEVTKINSLEQSNDF